MRLALVGGMSPSHRGRVRAAFLVALAVVGVLLGGCPPADTPAVFPADYAASYVEVRDCRRSPDHELAFIRVLTSPGAADTYRTQTGTFAEGAVVLKEEFADPDCTDLEGFSVMAREGGAWRWQTVTAERRVLEDGALPRCIACHSACDPQFEQTCALP